MARRKRHGRRGFRIGKYVNLAFKGLGAFVAASPAIRAWNDSGHNLENYPYWVVIDYIGLDPTTGHFDAPKATGGIGSVAAGILLAKLGGFLGRRF